MLRSKGLTLRIQRHKRPRTPELLPPEPEPEPTSSSTSTRPSESTELHHLLHEDVMSVDSRDLDLLLFDSLSEIEASRVNDAPGHGNNHFCFEIIIK